MATIKNMESSLNENKNLEHYNIPNAESQPNVKQPDSSRKGKLSVELQKEIKKEDYLIEIADNYKDKFSHLETKDMERFIIHTSLIIINEVESLSIDILVAFICSITGYSKIRTKKVFEQLFSGQYVTQNTEKEMVLKSNGVMILLNAKLDNLSIDKYLVNREEKYPVPKLSDS